MSERAWWRGAALAWLGMLGCLLGCSGCSTPQRALPSPDDAWIDRVWASLARGDLEEAQLAAARITDEGFGERARLDILAARAGRAAALFDCLDRETWLAARYDASREVALERLRDARRAGVTGAMLWLEEARASSTSGRAISSARAALSYAPGGAEALAIQVEALQAAGDHAAAEKLLAEPDLPATARLRLARHRQELATGRLRTACEGVLQDLRDDLAVPASLALLQDVLLAVPMRPVEEETLAALADAPAKGARMDRARSRLLARLHAASGELAEAVDALDALDLRAPAEDRVAELWACRLGRRAPATLEERVDADPDRPDAEPLLELRLASAWNLTALQSYDDADDGRSIDLPDFLERLDDAARGIRGAPSMVDLPRFDYGIFGTMVNTDPLRTSLPSALILSGKALGLPADMAWYDRQSCEIVPLPPGPGSYERCLVRTPRVLGYAASRGANIAGAGIDRVVYLDLDEIELGERESRLAPVGPLLPALPAHGREERRDLREPLDMTDRLTRLARRDAGANYMTLLIEALALHEEQHIRDFRDFVNRGVGGKLMAVLGAGLLPSSVRAEIERRAQLHALRTATDPRIPLAHAVAYLPAEGPAREGEHALGYASLVAEFIERLDSGRWEGAVPLPELGIDPERVLLQQLDRLPPETVRAIAISMDD